MTAGGSYASSELSAGQRKYLKEKEKTPEMTLLHAELNMS